MAHLAHATQFFHHGLGAIHLLCVVGHTGQSGDAVFNLGLDVACNQPAVADQCGLDVCGERSIAVLGLPCSAT